MATPKQSTKERGTPSGATAPVKNASTPSKPAPVNTEPEHQSIFVTKYQSLKKRLEDTWAEIKKITWPDRETIQNLTVLVIAMATFLGILLGGIDYVLLKVFEYV